MTDITWEHDSIEKYVVLVGRLINDINVNVWNEEAQANETLKVPVTYGPREKVIAAATRPTADDDGAQVAITLPRISFECTGLVYDAARQTPATKKIDVGEHSYIYNPPAYNFPFTVSVIAKSARVANRIVEQILPIFAGPAITATIKPLKDHPDYKRDVIIEHQGAQPNNDYQGDFNTRQVLGWDIQLLVKGWLFGPVAESTRITKVDVDFSDNTTTPEFLEGIDITPGLTSGGQPTSNAATTVPRNNIEPTDNYGYIIDYNSEGE